MSDMTLLPTSGIGGEAGAAGLGGAVGGLIGSWFGNGFGGRGGWGYGGGGDGVAIGVGANAMLDGINNIQTAVNGLGLQTLQGQNATNMTVERSATSTFNGLSNQNTQAMLANVQGFAGLNTAISQGVSTIGNAICAQSYEAQRLAYEAQLRDQSCCCETNLNIERQANATRDLMRQQFADSQAVLICDLKDKLRSAEFANSQLAQTAALNQRINEVYQLINFKLPTPPTPPTV
uniref:Uncharacterized protein n=1 Tax=Salmonella phage PMBT35 TaxID=3137287 RepID=A0AAU8BWP9_9VIRU